MIMHKRIRLTPHDREKIWQLWQTGEYKVSHLAENFKFADLLKRLKWPSHFETKYYLGKFIIKRKRNIAKIQYTSEGWLQTCLQIRKIKQLTLLHGL